MARAAYWVAMIVGLALAGLFGGAVAVWILRGLDAAAMLGFVGAAVGAAITVGGAVWVEDHRRRLDRVAELSLYKDALAGMDAALVAMARPQQGIDNNARKGEIVEALADYNGAWTDFLWAAERVTPRNLGDLAALRRVQTKIVSMREMVDREARIVADLPPTAVVLATYQDRAEFIAGEIRPVLSAAISRIPG